MESDPYFKHLMQELFSGPYLEGMDLNLCRNKDYKSKGPLTKSLLDSFRKVFAVQEISIKHNWSTYFEQIQPIAKSSPEHYVEYLIVMLFAEKDVLGNKYDRFLTILSAVVYSAKRMYYATGKNFFKFTPHVSSVFFENALREDFNQLGAWECLENNILSRKYNEYYEVLVASDFNFDEERELKIRELLLSEQLPFSSGVSEKEVYVNMSEVQYLTNKVMSRIEISLLKELDLPYLFEEQLVSKQAEESCSSKENGIVDPTDSNTKDYFGTEFQDFDNQLNRTEEKMKDLISVFELLDAK
ncbi:hypothetical protein NPIL_358731 [Nephila pilipes]|uniref:Uncharacterized protein n=1 Tax=Nephila pilipes TaxID=299642 RepID=A0A8X6IP48_NEPPI|nr:hypothetical protein NPIL_358731 [Nephila pilipes]